MLNEKPDTKGHILYDFFYLIYPIIGKSIETENRLEVARGWGEGEKGSDYLMRLGVFWGMMKSFETRESWLHNIVTTKYH